MSWNEAQEAWLDFLNQIEFLREELHCSYSNAWFRGHTNSEKYKLLPSLFRIPYADDADLLGAIRNTEEKINEFPKKWEYLLNEKKNIKKELYSTYNNNDQTKLEKAVSDLEKIENKICDLKANRNSNATKLKDLRLVYTGEREAFIEYSFRSGNSYQSSWETLAEMQHHGVPTRLLDWTENLAVALYFALKNYFDSLGDYWTTNRNMRKSRSSETPNAFPFYLPKVSEIPSIWVLNPYQVSKQATGRLRIWDLTLEKRYEYFENFIMHRSWHFDKPVPMYSPWRNPRLAAQQGMFTVFGYARESLDQQFLKGTAQEVKISPLAAVYGVKHLKQLFGIDHFLLFRDLDTLAKKVKEEFITR